MGKGWRSKPHTDQEGGTLRQLLLKLGLYLASPATASSGMESCCSHGSKDEGNRVQRAVETIDKGANAPQWMTPQYSTTVGMVRNRANRALVVPR